jgi:hypothetical protein
MFLDDYINKMRKARYGRSDNFILYSTASIIRTSFVRTTAGNKKKVTMCFPVSGYYTEKP